MILTYCIFCAMVKFCDFFSRAMTIVKRNGRKGVLGKICIHTRSVISKLYKKPNITIKRPMHCIYNLQLYSTFLYFN